MSEIRFQDIPQMTKSAPYNVTVTWQYLEMNLERYNDNGKLDLDPPFQRAHVWDEAKQQRYVEFVLRGGQSSRDIYFNQADFMGGFKAPMFLVDGKQRLEAVRKFLRGALGIFPDNSMTGKPLYFGDFTDRLPWSASFQFHVNDLPYYRDVLKWYLDLNAGGVAHTSDEIEKVKALLDAEDVKQRRWASLPLDS